MRKSVVKPSATNTLKQNTHSVIQQLKRVSVVTKSRDGRIAVCESGDGRQDIHEQRVTHETYTDQIIIDGQQCEMTQYNRQIVTNENSTCK
jgi:hypothetical protein